jgi:thiamine biosynthesis lipoprotein
MQVTSTSLRRARPLLGTFVEIDVDQRDAEDAVEAAFAAVAEVHRLMSFHEAGSDVSRLNRAAAKHTVSIHPWTYQVLEMAAEINRRSAGAFNIGVAPRLQQLGQLPCEPDAPPSATCVPTGDAIELFADNRVRFAHPSVMIDLGGIAKGFAVDCAIGELRGHGVRSAIVNAGGDLAAFGPDGGDLAVFGPDARAIHLRDPRSPGALMCQVEVSNQALASTARRFDPFHSTDLADTAVIEPQTQMPAHSVHGATVRAPSCMVADALTKVVMIAGKKAAAPLAHFRASAIFVSTDGDIHTTSDWQGVVQHAS